MAVSSLLFTLDNTVDLSKTLQALRRFPSLTLGTPCGIHVPAVLDTPSPQHDRDAVLLLGNVVGVAKVDVLCIFLGQEQAPPRRSA